MEILIAVFFLLVLAVIWVSLYETHHYVITTMTVRDKKIKKKIKAVFLSDLHNQKYGRGNERILEDVRSLDPDLVLVAGDMITASRGEKLDQLDELMQGLVKIAPVYYGNGNHECRLKLHPEVFGNLGQRLEEILQKDGVTLLINEYKDLEDLGIRIYGSEIDKFYYGRFGIKPMEDSYLKELLGTPDPGRFNILIAHNPDYFPQYASWGADISLAGHVHGGIARIPLWSKDPMGQGKRRFRMRGVISPNIRLFPEYDGGMFAIGESKMIVSRGMGTHAPVFRFWDPAEMIVIEFEPEK